MDALPETRGRDFWLAALFLSRCGVVQDGGNRPPAQLRTTDWTTAYARLYQALGFGRDSRQFANSLKNARDQYDAYFPQSNRVGWRLKALPNGDRPAGHLTPMAREVKDEWGDKSDEEIWKEVEPLVSFDDPLASTRPLPARQHAETSRVAESPKSSRPVSEIVRSAIATAGLAFADDVADDLYLSLRTKPFVILSGLSGTGKTKIAIRMAEILCERSDWELVAVRPDWADSKGLLGFLNLLTDRFQATPVTRLLVRAAEDWQKNGAAAGLYGVVLDEMNLARVEYYFAEFLSALESRRLGADGKLASEPILLHDQPVAVLAAGEPESGLRVPGSIELPPNFFVVGTVNVDETTQPFSRKVLDRANTIELFDVDLTRSAPAATTPLTAADLGRVRAHFTRDGAFIDISQPPLESGSLGLLVGVNAALEPHRLHFGYRVRDEILRFVEQAGDERLLGLGEAAKERARDIQLLQKVLPKMSGSRDQLQTPLRALLGLTLGADRALMASISNQFEGLYAELDRGSSPADGGLLPSGFEPRYPQSARKITRMLLELKELGYASFFE